MTFTPKYCLNFDWGKWWGFYGGIQENLTNKIISLVQKSRTI